MTSSQLAPIDAHPCRWICGKQTRLDAEPGSPEMAHVTLERVAIALAYTNRFVAMWGPASTSDHQIRVAGYLRPELKLAGATHDIGEIVTGDIPKPFKRNAPELVAIEDAWARKLAIHLFGDRIGLATASLWKHPEVKAADEADYFDMLEGQELQLRHLERMVADPWAGKLPDRGVDSARAWAGLVRHEMERFA